MDESRTLSILGWVVGGLIGAMFLLNAVALSQATGTAARTAAIYTD
jgi:uncharacterized membrane protein YdcZ (DUF606 family)